MKGIIAISNMLRYVSTRDDGEMPQEPRATEIKWLLMMEIEDDNCICVWENSMVEYARPYSSTIIKFRGGLLYLTLTNL